MAIPTEIKRANGNPGKRPLDRDEPKPRRVPAKAPAHLTAAAKREFLHMAPILERMRVLTEADLEQLAILATDSATLKAVQKQIAAPSFEFLVVTTHGTRANPLLKICHDLTLRVTAGLREFGMTPAARTRIRIEKAAVDDNDIQRTIAALSQPRTDTARVQ